MLARQIGNAPLTWENSSAEATIHHVPEGHLASTSLSHPQTRLRRAQSRLRRRSGTSARRSSVRDDDESGQWVSDAEVAEVGSFTAFASRPKAERVQCRLVVRRVNVKPDSQESLFATWRYHAFITNSDLSTVKADRRHRGHAIVEQVIAELKQGPLAHLPSGKFVANQAWLAFAIIAFNLARAAARAAGMGLARWQTLLKKIIMIPARLARTGRRLIIHLPKLWPWQAQWSRLWAAASGP